MPKIIKPAKGTFTTADITVDGTGRVVAASSGCLLYTSPSQRD